MRSLTRAACAAAVMAAAALLSGCGSSPPKPAPLEVVTPRIAGKQVWRQSLGGAPLPGLSVAVQGDRFIVASRDGVILALDASTGAERARIAVGERLTAGVGSDGRFLAVVGASNDLIVLEGGKVRWRSRLGSRAVTAPLVAGERVFVQRVDRTIEAYDVLDGRKLWSLSRSGEPLALAQPGVLLPFKDTLLAGQGARLLQIDPLLGTLRQELALPAQRGTNEVERLADLVAPAVRSGEVLCLRAFQSSVGCVQVERNQLRWSRNFGGYQGVAADADVLVAADGSDRVSAWKASTGDLLWSHERLRNRGLSAPLISGSTVVFGDFEGWLHFFGRERGDSLLRLPTDGSGIAAPLVRSGTTLLAITRSGGVHAFRPE
ncbi:PQQ-binding-like beta-propeller repeat protein [Leptothrix discophora]|uniref:Outer membrane protein assembly factor BamB n=1 Tax=Leptothrix discophora TaxID=89 RepID=A0ABT9G0X7_LEPDI|nr:PQQ-binding-like beta-propeller repeat protein [Leptothrix discophora]MDP4300139.1 PQQ-binding-like beta-propeller repeat protein [Leptothrix discophora]